MRVSYRLTLFMLAAVLVPFAGCKPKSQPSNSSPSTVSNGTEALDEPAFSDPATADAAAETPDTVQSPISEATVEPLEPPASSAPPNASSEASAESTLVEELKLFDGWATPDVAIIVTGQQKGYIEPCGCAGLANQKGGLARRHAMVRDLEAKGWPVLAVDAGNQVRRFGRQAELKFQFTTEGLKTIGYDAIAFGENDLRLSVGEVAAATMAMDDEASPFVCANAAVLDRSLTPRFHVLEAGGVKIGVTAILGTEEQQKVTSGEVVLQPVAEALAEVVPLLKERACDLYVLLSHASLDESREIAKQFGDFDVIVSSGGLGDPTYEAEKVQGSKAILIQVGVKGMFAGVVGVFNDSDQRLRYQRVPLDASYDDSPEMLQLLKSYQDQLKATGLAGLGVKPIPHSTGNSFVGSQACADCHTKAFEVWEATPHAHATDTLVHPGERSQIERHFDPECLSCHVTGWNAQDYFPYKSGYLSLEETPLLVGNGCENCHGPGSAHVAAELGDIDADDEMLKSLRVAMRLTKAKAEQKCLECHDLDNDPEFQKLGAFDRYWPKVEHPGLD